MKEKNKVDSKPKQILRVISQTAESVKVMLPSVELPVDMSTKYFDYLQSTGAYVVLYCISSAL